MVVTGNNDEEIAGAASVTRAQLAFYGSTPAYKVVLDAHGWGNLQPELNRLSKTGDWGAMSALITDEIVDTFTVSGPPDEIGARVNARYGDLVQRVSFDTPNKL